ncbi:MAG: hypothetical protein M3P08_02505 [Thermoproteota archaeon]|jgi:hypothetical protein|nr:hypothetical protein [Thermoproteota archaeon]
MEIFESVAWVASGFVPTLLLLEVYERMGRRKVLGKKKSRSSNIVSGYQDGEKICP